MGGGTEHGGHVYFSGLAEGPAGGFEEHSPRLAFGQEAEVDGVADVFAMGGAEAVEDGLVFSGVDEVTEVLRVALAIVEFLDRARGGRAVG